VPAEVDEVQRLVVRQEDHLARELRLGRRRQHVVDLAQQRAVVGEPAVVDHHGREVEVHLVARATKSFTARMRRPIGLVRTSSTRATRRGMSEKRTRVRPRGS
jgi:hypothetical protein